MRPGRAALVAALCLGLAGAPAVGHAQEGQATPDFAVPDAGTADVDATDPDAAGPGAVPGDQPPQGAAFVTLNQERLFKESAWGRAALARAETDGKALASENRRIEEALEKEERDLTDRRATLKPTEFAAIASAFDTKVEEIRAAQEGKSRSIQRGLEEDRQRFFQVVTPIMGELLAESGATAILADTAIIMSLSSIDITSTAIARIDQRLPAPVDEGAAANPDPVQDSAPQPAPQPAPQTTP